MAEQPRVSMVVATRNRAHTLRLVAGSYYAQPEVDEIVFVDDAGTDDTGVAIAELAQCHPDVTTIVLRNEARAGASESRNRGVAAVRNPLVLFCDDDEMLTPDYAAVCLAKLREHEASAVSGRRIYMRDGESAAQAVRRFGIGLRGGAPYHRLLCEHVAGARLTADVELPFTTAVILTPTSLVRQFGFDGHYATGNGYREESDYQMNLFVHGHRIIMTPACHSIHLSPAQTRSGGQRASRWQRVYWSVHYTEYFYRKYWHGYAARLGLRTPRTVALAVFAVFSAYREYLRPSIYRAVFAAMRLRAAI